VIKRIITALLCFVLLALLPFQVSAAGADANTPQTHPNTYTNTGDQRKDIVGVALTQQGYLEYPNNNTKYGAALNINHLGWCGAFVSWCAIQAGVPDSVLYKTGVANPASYGLTAKYYPEYIPQTGDLFFAMDNSHVGLVYYLDGEYFYSIEGNTYTSNSGGGVYVRKHKLSSVKYGAPNYGGGGSKHKYVQGVDAEHPHKVYQKCSDCGDVRYTGATVKNDNCLICKQASCTHSYGDWKNGDSSKHIRTCTKCYKEDSAAHKYDKGVVTKEANCKENGIKTQTCTACGAKKEVSIPKGSAHAYGAWTKQDNSNHVRYCSLCNTKQTKSHNWDEGIDTVAATCVDSGIRTFSCKDCGAEKQSKIPVSTKHNYSAWQLVDESKHTHSCLVCGKTETKKHSFGKKYASNSTSHWYECSDCHHTIKTEKHEFGDACDSPCKICGYKSETGHHFVEEWTTDANSHWHACQSCTVQGSAANHVYDNACDAVCDTCQFQRDVSHDFGDGFLSDGMHHWKECKLCGIQTDYGNHVSSEAKYEGASTYCTVCNLTLTNEKNHVHVYTEAYGDLENHWGVCGCGEILETQPHSWSMRSGTCSVCGAARPQVQNQDDELIPWILGGGGLVIVVTGLIVAVVVTAKKLKKKEEIPV